MKSSYIATKKRKHDDKEERFHVTAVNIIEAAMEAHDVVDGLWEIIKIEVLR